MKHYSKFLLELEKKCKFPEEANTEINKLAKRLDDEKDFGKKFDKIRKLYMYPWAHNLGRYLEMVRKIGEEYGVTENSIEFMFLLQCAELLKKRFLGKGVSEEIYWDSMNDLRYKLLECMECEYEVGTFVGGWFAGWFEVDRFTLGRFQFEPRTVDEDYTTKSGYKIKKGDFCVGMHIPSSGVPLTDEVRFDSYKRAYEFFKDRLTDGKLIIKCGSWLLYENHYKFLPEHLNIRKFMDDFDIYNSEESENFGDDWRVFGHYTDFPLEEWPEDTSLRKAYKHWLLGGGKAGHGEGIIVFDGEKIISK